MRNDHVDQAEEIAEARCRLGALGFAVPDACLPGVAENLALLDRHWRIVRGRNTP